MGSWTDKPCVGCDRRKSKQYADRKYCYRCGIAVRKASAEIAHRRRVARTYGIEPTDYDRLYAAQGGHCALCQRATGATRRLSVDHNHATGEVRGLLCRPCNDLLGHARDSVDFFARCMAYLSDAPARAVLRAGSGSPCRAQAPPVEGAGMFVDPAVTVPVARPVDLHFGLRPAADRVRLADVDLHDQGRA